MGTMLRNRQYNFRVNNDMLEQAKAVLEARNISIPDALNLFVETVVKEQDLPIKTIEERRAETFLAELTSELDKGYQAMLRGEMKDADEVFAKYEL
ncbi:type II toxin-antitoxin system RelB/ParD family antitoxin [Streptococcus mutans]|nr:type II toxin-antitoxin system RelB/DinJ family antitoxin [Streptococcus mutans]EMC19642.1 plasmid stabilization system, antitoxin protein [Streptococcus mutans NV1996]